MNAGAEYVAYRIWATLQDRRGIHPESLLTCLGALAGYACQACVPQTALHASLIESPLSVWAFVSRAVRKLGKPPPDIESILHHVTQAVGTSAFAPSRVPDGHRPRHAAIVYVQQIWPQILPIARPFCSKRTQIPVLFGIALQRAIEQTKDVLSPTLGASIAMESAIAMSKAIVPGLEAHSLVARSTPVVAKAAVTSRPVELAALASRAESTLLPMSRRKRRGIDQGNASAPGFGARVASLPRAVRLGAIASVAFIAMAGAMYKADRREGPQTARELPKLENWKFQQTTPALEESPQPAQISEEPPPIEAATAQRAPDEYAMSEASQAQPQPPSDGSAEIVIPE